MHTRSTPDCIPQRVEDSVAIYQDHLEQGVIDAEAAAFAAERLEAATRWCLEPEALGDDALVADAVGRTAIISTINNDVCEARGLAVFARVTAAVAQIEDDHNLEDVSERIEQAVSTVLTRKA